MNDHFCVMPFFGQEINPNQSKEVSCCLLPAQTDINTVRDEMLKGNKPKECSKCWNLELSGIESDRLIKNRTYDFYADKDINIVQQECKQGKYSKQIVKIYTSKLCNSTCVTCNPQSSTAWASLKKVKITQSDTIPDCTIQNLNYKDLKILSFVGGEPLYENKNFEILQNLLDNQNKDCFVSFVTNGSVILSDKKIDLLSKFRNLNVCLSIDGIESRFNYLRYPLQWDLLQKNLQIFKSLHIDLSVSFTISNLNIFYYTETIDWFKQNKLKFNHNLVTNPEYFDINALPQSVKHNLPSDTKSLLRTHLPSDDMLFQQFAKEIDTQDKLKKISMADYMPEMYKIIMENI